MYVVYCITNTVTGKKYFGETGNPIARKWTHWYWGRQNYMPKKGVCQALVGAMQKYGNDAFTFEIVQECLSKQDAQAAEPRWIAQYNSMVDGNGYNLNAGGKGGCSPSPETRAKMSAAQKGRKHTPETRAKIAAGLDTPEIRAKQSAASRGKTHTPETRTKMSTWQKGRRRTPETRAKMSAWQRGRIISPETRAKMSAAQKGRKHTPETRAKIAAGNKGRTLSIEARGNISAARKGKAATPEARANMSASQKARYQAKRETCELELAHSKPKAQISRVVLVHNVRETFGLNMDEFLALHPNIFDEEPTKPRSRERRRSRDT